MKSISDILFREVKIKHRTFIEHEGLCRNTGLRFMYPDSIVVKRIRQTHCKRYKTIAVKAVRRLFSTAQ